MLSLRRKIRPSDASWFSTTTASPNSSPFLVPPKRQDVDAGVGREVANGTPSEAAAFESRAPSMCSFMPWLVRVVGDRAHLVRGVERAEFGGLRDRDRERLRAVLVAPSPCLAVDEVRGELAVWGRHGAGA